MQHTLVAVFDARREAQNALDALVSSGFPLEKLTLSDADPTGMTDSTGHSGAPVPGVRGRMGAPIRHIFTDLFGADNSIRASKYEGAVTRGHHVLVVSVDSMQEAERAADVVERFGPTDIDEQVSGAGATDIGGPPGSPYMSSPGGVQQSSQVSAQSGTILGQEARPGTGLRAGRGPIPHLDNPGDRGIFQQHSLNRPEPTGTTYQEPLGESGLGATGETSLHGSTLRENSTRVPSLEDSDTGTRPPGMSAGGASSGSARFTETRRGSSRIYSPESSSTAPGGGLDIGSRFFGDDDDYYRNHFLANYSGQDYEHLEPAYSYGAEMRKSELYRNRPWDDVEGDLARGWHSLADTGSPLAGAWDRMKAAMRHGWERITADEDERAYRSHWNTHYRSSAGGAGYDEYKPAYAYGAEMARDERYRGRAWSEVEGELRAGWDARYGSGGQSTWEKMGPAVRHGWDRMAS